MILKQGGFSCEAGILEHRLDPMEPDSHRLVLCLPNGEEHDLTRAIVSLLERAVDHDLSALAPLYRIAFFGRR